MGAWLLAGFAAALARTTPAEVDARHDHLRDPFAVTVRGGTRSHTATASLSRELKDPFALGPAPAPAAHRSPGDLIDPFRAAPAPTPACSGDALRVQRPRQLKVGAYTCVRPLAEPMDPFVRPP